MPVQGLGLGVLLKLICFLTTSCLMKVQTPTREDLQGAYAPTTEAFLLESGLVELWSQRGLRLPRLVGCNRLSSKYF